MVVISFTAESLEDRKYIYFSGEKGKPKLSKN